MMSKLKKIRDALTGIENLNVNHYWRSGLQPPYCIWAEDDEGVSLVSDNRKAEQVISGTVDYFTKTEYDPMVEKIQNALDEVDTVSWRLSSTQYEDETMLIHYEWTFEVA